MEREQTADRTRLAIQARAERGLWNGGSPPLGYDSQVHRATVHPDRVELALFDGRHASRYLQQATRNGVIIGATVLSCARRVGDLGGETRW